MPSISERARAVYMSMPSPPRFSRGSSKSASTDVAGPIRDADAPETRASSDAETRAETPLASTPHFVAGASLPSHHSRHPSGLSDITVDSDEGSEGGNETDVSEATAEMEAERDREMYRTMSPSGRTPRRTRASGEEAASTPMGAIDDELRRLEDVPMISLENFMRFRGGDDAETGSGYESESSLAESLAESSSANDASASASRPPASDAAHYDANTDLDVEEEVDPRVGAALDEMNDAASGVNDLEKALARARRRRRAARSESEKKLEAIRLRVAKSVRNAVPYFHQQALASTHERNAQDALAQYERAHDAYALARDDVESKMKVWRERSRENGFEAPERLTPSKRADLAAANEAAELTAYVEISESRDLNVLEATRTRAENAYGTHIKNATASIDAALRLKRKLTRTIGKARPYFEAKAMAEGAWDALDEKVRDAQEDVREGKRRYQRAMAELARISEEVHERREREKAEREAERARAEAEVKRETEAVVSALVAFALETVIARAEAEAQAAREAAEAAAREAAAREKAAREEAEAAQEAAREAAEAVARENAAKEAADAAAKERVETEAREAAERQVAAREASEREAEEAAARDAAEKEASAREAVDAADLEAARRGEAAVADVSSEETETDESNEALVRSVVADAVASVADAATAKANAEASAAALDFFGLDDAAAPAPAPADDPFESLASLEPAAAATVVRENGSGVANAPVPATGSLMDF